MEATAGIEPAYPVLQSDMPCFFETLNTNGLSSQSQKALKINGFSLLAVDNKVFSLSLVPSQFRPTQAGVR